MTQTTEEGKGLFCSQFHTPVHPQKHLQQEPTQGRTLEAGADAEALGECMVGELPTGLTSPGLFSLPYNRLQDHQLTGPPPSITY